MNPINAKSRTYIDFAVENNDKDCKCDQGLLKTRESNFYSKECNKFI